MVFKYSRCCSHYDDFGYPHNSLVDQLLPRRYKVLWLKKSFKNFYGRHQNLIEKSQRSFKEMVSDSFPGYSFLYVFNKILVVFSLSYMDLRLEFVTWIFQYFILLLAVMSAMHETDTAHSIWGTW